MRTSHISLILILALSILTTAYDQHDDFRYIMSYYQQNSQYPIIHAYYNQHFSSTHQFEDFLVVLEQTEYRNKDYARFLLTDCQKMKVGDSKVCDDMRRTKDNHAVLGYYPSGEFISYAGKKMQNPPKTKYYRHPRDVYTVDELETFLRELLPNFYEEINSIEHYQSWVQPRYSPNLIFATREDQVPEVIKQIGIHFFLRFDLGYLSDLTESVVDHLNITAFPALLVLKYNYLEEAHEVHRYSGRDFSTSNYQTIKQFLEPLSLTTPRNDLLYHKMKIPQNHKILKTDRVDELSQMLERSNGWVFVEEAQKQPVLLEGLKKKYGRFFDYIHFVNSSATEERLTLYDPERKNTFALPNKDINWRPLGHQEFVSNISLFLTKGFAVMGVRQKYAHFCSLALSTFFRGLTHCFILKQSEYDQASKSLNMAFDYGFVVYEKEEDGKKQVAGNNFKNDVFEDVYLTAEYQTRLKSKEIIDAFFDRPIKLIEGTDKIAEICAFPFKKCALLFTDSDKYDRTAYEYLKEVAKNFINEYQFYEIDLKCNQHFQQQIPHLKKSTNGLVVYHPRKDSYVYLKAKLSSSTFERFLKANLVDDDKLPFKKWKTLNIQAHGCSKKTQKDEDKDEQKAKNSDAESSEQL